MRRPDGKQTVVLMHRFILGLTDRKVKCDHVDNDGLNNQRYNLRPSTHAQNMQNRSVQKNNTSGIAGVDWRIAKQRWQVRVGIDGKQKHLGYFTELEDAAAARLAGEIQYHGEFSAALSRAA